MKSHPHHPRQPLLISLFWEATDLNSAATLPFDNPASGQKPAQLIPLTIHPLQIGAIAGEETLVLILFKCNFL